MSDKYNPHAPVILGNEFVPVSSDSIDIPSTRELGFSFHTDTAMTLPKAAWYASAYPNGLLAGDATLISVYPKGREADTGPIRRIILPVINGSVTGASYTNSAVSMSIVLNNPTDQYALQFNSTQPATQLAAIQFSVMNAATVLTGKRILAVNVLYVAAGDWNTLYQYNSQNQSTFGLYMNSGPNYSSTNSFSYGQPFTGPQILTGNNQLFSTPLGELTPFFGTTTIPYTNNPDRFPWRYQELQRLDSSSSTPLSLIIGTTGFPQNVSPALVINFSYMALEVLYCEEQRVMVAGAAFGQHIPIGDGAYNSMTLGPNQMNLRAWPAGTTNPTLQPNDYTVTVTHADLGTANTAGIFTGSTGSLTTIDYSILRQLYQPLGMENVQVNRSLVVNDSFTTEVPNEVPTIIFLNAGNAPVSGTQAYVIQDAAPIYDANPAVQSVIQDARATSASYTQARFYARRFGDTDQPLVLSNVRYFDTFNRTVASGWGTSTTGDTYTTTRTGGTSNDLAVSPNAGKLTISVANEFIQQRMASASMRDGEFFTYVNMGAPPVSGTGATIDWFARYIDATHNYQFRALIAPSGAVTAQIILNNGGASTLVSNVVTGLTYTTNTQLGIRCQIYTDPVSGNTLLNMRCWSGDEPGFINNTNSPPVLWNAQAADSTLPFANTWAIRVNVDGQVPRTFSFSQYQVVDFMASQATSVASITPTQFDALPEIYNGWKEVTLRFNNALTLTNSLDLMLLQFTSDNLLIGHRWEVLFSDTYPSFISVGNNTTYSAVSYYGTQSYLQHDALQDVSADAVLMLSQDAPAVSGLAVTPSTQAMTTVIDCTSQRSIPTGVGYNRVTWNTPQNTAVLDTFSRTVVSGWGTSDTGQAWTTAGGVSSAFNVSGGVATHSLTTVGTFYASALPWSTSDVDVTVYGMSASAVSSGAPIEYGVQARYVDDNNYVHGRLFVNLNGNISIAIRQLVAGVETFVGFPLIGGTNAFTPVNFRLQVWGNTIRCKGWLTGTTEPPQWTTAMYTTWTTPGSVRVVSLLEGGNTNTLPVTISFDKVTVSTYNFGYLQLQRFDSIDNAWTTIMQTTSPLVSGFNDYEARVGVASQYRIAQANALEFLGPWSNTVSATVPAPGVTGSRVDNGVLLFTSNYRQAGANNLAYTASWDNAPSEDLTFIEASNLKLQQMYTRDYQVAFRPSERGGEQFTRILLVNNLIVPPSSPVLENAMTTLRNLAWDDLPYVCVRNELGDRWYANVNVPSASIQRNRRIQLVQAQVTEVQNTPYAVDPALGN